jgi:hypothetical protein
LGVLNQKEIEMFQGSLFVAGFACLGVAALAAVLVVPHLIGIGFVSGVVLTTIACFIEE